MAAVRERELQREPEPGRAPPERLEPAASGAQKRLEESIGELLTFQGCQDALRGIPLSRVLRACGKIFENSEGSAATYQLSQQVQRIDVFLSHNWVVSRFVKFTALAFHFNFLPAVAITLVAALALALLTAAGVAPTVQDLKLSWSPGYLARLLVAPIFVAVLFGLRAPMAALRQPGPMLFLDKACIHQTDAALKATGIRKLGAFLVSSDRMLILYSSVYLERLWTVYEVASFLAFRDVASIEVVPVFRPLLFLGMVAVQWLQVLVAMVVRTATDTQLVSAGMAVVAMFAKVILLRRWMISRQDIFSRLGAFDVHKAVCFDERDRGTIYENISVVMRGAGLVDAAAPQHEALAAFNAKVRRELTGAFKTSMGRRSFSYWQYATVGCFGSLVGLDNLAGVADGVPERVMVVNLLAQFVAALGLWPLLLAGLDVVASSFLELRGVGQAAWITAGTLLLSACAVGLFSVGNAVLDAAADGEQWSLLVAGLFAVMMPLVAYLSIAGRAGLSCSRARRGGPRSPATLATEVEVTRMLTRTFKGPSEMQLAVPSSGDGKSEPAPPAPAAAAAAVDVTFSDRVQVVVA